MPARTGKTTYVPDKGALPKRKGRRKAEVAGPYRSQSSVPEIREGATKREHRRARTTAPKRQSHKGRPKRSDRAATARRKARRIEQGALKNFKESAADLKVAPAPEIAYEQAKVGVKPPAALRKEHPRAYDKAERAYIHSIAAKEGLKEDPLAEFVISTAATAGLGAAVKGAASLTKSALAARAGSEIASTGATVGSKAAETAVKGVAARTASKAGKAVKARATSKAARIRSTPKRIKSAPKRAKKAASTKQGRRAATKGAARNARRHPVRTSYGAAAASPVPLPGEVDQRARAAAEGTFDAITQHPIETGKTTLRALPAAITAPAALLASGVESAIKGTPDPLVNTASEQAKGVAEIASNVFSGDPEKAEMAARKEGSLTFLTPLPAVSRLKAFKRTRKAFRKGAANARRKAAAKSEAANRSVRHAPKGVEQNVFGLTARRQARKKTALVKQRADNPQRVAAAHHERQITQNIAKAPKGSEVALQALAEYGIRDSKGAALVREKGPGDAQLTKALDYVDTHPEVFQSKAFARALEAVGEASRTAPAALVGKGERARLMQQGDALGHARPEQMVPSKAKGLTTATTREGAWAELAAADKRLGELRRQGRQRLDQAKVLKGADRARAMREGKALYAQAREQKKQNQALYNALDPYTRPGQAIDGSARTAYDSRMLAEYKAAVEASRAEAGLAPAIWTHHAEADTAGRGSGMENRFPISAGRVEHMREGALAKADNLDRSLQGLVRGSAQMPRLRAAGKQFGRDFVQAFKTPFSVDGKQKVIGQGSKDWTAITSPKTKDNPNGGQFDPKSWARFPLREWKNAIKDPFTQDTRLVELLTEAEAGRIKGSEPWVLMPREAIREARAQISPDHNVITQTANRLSRVASRTLLGTNPAWAIAQIPAEGIPLLMAKPSLLNPVKFARLERDIQRYKKSHPEEALALQATAGASPVNAAVNRTPLDMQETYTPALWDKGAKALTRGKTARTAVSFAKLRALGVFDVKRQNEYRTLLAAAEADKRFRSWHGGLTGLFDSQARLNHRFRGKSREELWTWLTKDPKGKAELQKITDYVDNIQGNWTAFTRYERSLAPLAIFYPFLRYSLRWTLWSFPRTHPTTATIAYMLGQANANQLEKLTGSPLQNPVGYAFPVTTDEEGEKSILPGGSRISPGQSSLTQALQSGNPAQILSSANPFIGAGLTAVTGIEPFTGEKADQQGWAALNQLITLPAPVRLAKLKVGEDQSVASKAFQQYDPNRTTRSLLFPFLPQSGKAFAESERLSKAFDQKYAKNAPPSLPKAYWEAALNHDWKLANTLRKEVLQAERAGDVIKAAEQPFYGDSKEFDDEASEILKYITGYIQIPVEEEEEEGQYGSGSGQYSSGAGQYGSGSGGQYGSGAGQYSN